MRPRTAIIILIVLYTITAIVFWYLYTHKGAPKPSISTTQQDLQNFERLTDKEKVIKAMENMQMNSGSGRGSQQKVLDAFNKMK